MDYSVRRSQCGIVSARLVIDLMRSIVEIALREKNTASHADLALLCAALFIAQAEGQSLTSAKLAAYAGMPRPSAIRKLRELARRGIVVQDNDKRWRIKLERQSVTRRGRDLLATHLVQIYNAQNKLFKMDSLKVAAQIRRE